MPIMAQRRQRCGKHLGTSFAGYRFSVNDVTGIEISPSFGSALKVDIIILNWKRLIIVHHQNKRTLHIVFVQLGYNGWSLSHPIKVRNKYELFIHPNCVINTCCCWQDKGKKQRFWGIFGIYFREIKYYVDSTIELYRFLYFSILTNQNTVWFSSGNFTEAELTSARFDLHF